MFKVAITDYSFPSLEIEQSILQSADCHVVSGQCRTPEALIELVSDADAVITQFAPVNADVIQAMQRARVIVRYGIGYDNVDCTAAKAKGIPVCNIPDYCIDEVADQTLAFTLSLTRCVPANHAHLMSGQWGLGVPLTQMRAMRDQTVGIIGLGRIGKAVAERLRPFRCRVLGFDPVISSQTAASHGCSLTTFDELLQTSDIVTLHCPSNEHTRGIINAKSLSQMKQGAILINVGRGDLVRLDALADAIRSGQISGAALDVFETEPLPLDSPIRTVSNVVFASHIASASPKAVRTLRETAAQLALQSLRGEPLANVVNGVVR